MLARHIDVVVHLCPITRITMKKTITTLLFLSFIALLSAQESWDLERCVIHAISNSLDVKQAELNISSSELSTRLSQEERYPSLSFSTNTYLNFGRSIDPTSNEFITASFFSNNYSINTGVTLYDGGRLKKSIEHNKVLEGVAHADLETARATLTRNVLAAYFEVLFSIDYFENGLIQLKTVEDQMTQMQKMIDAGSRAAFELYDLQAQRATIEQSNTAANNRIELAYINLKSLLNLPNGYDIRIAEPPVEQKVYTPLVVVTLDEVVSKAWDFLPESAAADMRIKSTQLGVEIAKAGFYPTITFGGSLSSNFSNQAKQVDGGIVGLSDQGVFIDGNPAVISFPTFSPNLVNTPYFNQIDNNFGYGFGAQINVPIYSNYRTKGSVQRAKIDLETNRINKDRTFNNLYNTMGGLLADARAAKEQLNATERTLQARQIALDNAEKRYGLGAINSYDYISIQDQLNTAKTNQIIARYDYMYKVKLLDYYQGYPVQLKN